MPCNPAKNPCPPTCPKVKEQLRTAIKELPNVTDGIFPRKKNDVVPTRLPPDVISRDIRDEPKRVIAAYIPEISVDVRPEELKDIEARPIVSQEFPIIQETTVIPIEKIADDIKEKPDLIKKEKLIQEPLIVQEETVTPTEKVDRDEEKIDFVEEKDLVQEPAIIAKETVTPTEKIIDRDEEKIDFVEEKDSVVERIAVEPEEEKKVPEPEIIEEKIERVPAAKIELEPPREEEHFEPEEPVEYGEEEESITDYEKFIDEELQESLPAGIAREIPEEPRAVRREISRNAATLHERIDRERPVRPPRERAAVTAMPERPTREEERIVSPEAVEDACDETCPLIKEQKERIMRKLKMRQRIVDHYYLTKGFSYFEDVCTCSLACMVYTLSRDPFVKSIFASLALFAVGLKLCSELDAWEMPSRVS